MKKMWMLIGPSGSGKSTISTHLIDVENEEISYYSFDDLRLKWYNPDNYHEAWLESTQDNQFTNKVRKEFDRLLTLEKSIIVDNTNLTRKSRKWFIKKAKESGYETIGIVFDVPLQTLIDRQYTRSDKCVPSQAVIRQYTDLQYPSLDEFDCILKSNQINK